MICDVTIEILNLFGQRVTTRVDEEKSAGTCRIAWDGTDADGTSVATGNYVYCLKAGDYQETKKMMLLK